MIVQLAFGQGSLPVEVPDSCQVFSPRHLPPLPDERSALDHALQHPVGSPPLRSLLHPTSRVCITFTDSTRATPNHRLIPWILNHLNLAPSDRVTLLNQTGSHRPNTPAELDRMLTPEIARHYRVLNHDAGDPSSLIQVGTLRDGTPALLNRHVVEADLRIVTGFIEPHFFAGFSGGPKGIMPGCAGLETILANHGHHHISNPLATYGITHGNPLWEELRDIARLAGPSFLVNVTLDEHHALTGIFAGDLIAAHDAGTRFVRDAAMQPVDSPFDIVLTSNSGSPLDLNLYQGVKGISTASRIVKPGGLILLACECPEGIPHGSPMHHLLRDCPNPNTLLHRIAQPKHRHPEQWQAQILAQACLKAEIHVHSRIPDADLKAIHLHPCPDPTQTVRQRCAQLGPGVRVAALPLGPLTLPTLA